MDKKRASGVVLHVSSLPGPYGIGSLGAGARAFADFLKAAGQRYWQILPLTPTGFGDSPYQSCSGRAGNPYFIDLDILVEKNLLERDEADAARTGDNVDYVNYGMLYETRLPILRKAFGRARQKNNLKKTREFEKQNASWLDNYALFMALKGSYDMRPLALWPDADIVAREPSALKRAELELAEEIEFHKFLQYEFFIQFADLKKYVNGLGVKIIGDLPFYVSEDSAEIWTEGELFLLDGPAKPSAVAGVPPDLYSETGQLWGNPLYNWKHHERDCFKWWTERIKHLSQFCDIVRIDHFRAFHTYWEIAADEKTAMAGCWRKGPGMKLVDALREAVPDVDIIAEDLGELDTKAHRFIEKSGLPGMSVLIYAFHPSGESVYLPHNIKPEKVVYTSTHDSPTFVDWLIREATIDEREFANSYLRLREDEGLSWGVIKSAWGTPAKIAMTTMQDILGLGADSRMNIPSTLGGLNWRWRVRGAALNMEVAERLREVTHVYGRLKKPSITA